VIVLMKKNNFLKIVFFLFFVLPILHACNQDTHFEKTKWLEKENLSYPYRNVMLDDLVTNYKLTGLTYQQLEDLLGQPDSLNENRNEVVYEIKVAYDLDIDPVYVKNLIFVFSTDSTVISYKIEEYQRAALKEDEQGDMTISSINWLEFLKHDDLPFSISNIRNL